MRRTRTFSITLPPEILARAAEIVRREHRTMSELVREALREYERKNG
jgi:metal-responsive CopG/Arc/MetJ family transcriptional regulator